MNFELTILGSNAAAPAHNRNQTSQVLHLHNYYFLIDCGEGTQTRLRKYKIPASKINHIFISHLHGDHYLGLMGLLLTMNLHHRTQPLSIYGPVGLGEILTVQFKYSESHLTFQVTLVELDTKRSYIVFEDDHIQVATIPLSHRISCCGFKFQEKPKLRRLIKEKIDDQIALAERTALKKGLDIMDESGKIKYKNSNYTLPPKRSRSYAYCSDTRYDPGLVKYLLGVDLLYHEATFLSDMEERAASTYHSTARQAAKIASKAGVERLLIGHFSIRYRELGDLLQEAQETFANSELAIEGRTFEIQE